MSDNVTSKFASIPELGIVDVSLSSSAVIISIIAIICNTLLIFVIIRSRLLKTPTNIFIASLTVGELIISVFGIPFAAVSAVSRDWPFSMSFCQISASLQIIGRSSSTYSLTAVCIDRCLAVSKPLKYSHILTLTTCTTMLTCIWLLSLIIGLLPLGNWGSYQYANGYYLCTLFKSNGGKQHVTKEIICSYLPTLVICFTILKIVKEVKSHHRIFAIIQLPVATSSNIPGEMLPGFIPGQRVSNRNITKAMRSLFIVTSAYLIFCLPVSFLNIIYHDNLPDKIVAQPVVTSIVWMSFLYCAVNPIIIIAFNRKFRAQLKILFNHHRLCQPLGANKEVFTISTGLHHILDATLVLNIVKHENASTTASIRRQILRLGIVK